MLLRTFILVIILVWKSIPSAPHKTHPLYLQICSNLSCRGFRRAPCIKLYVHTRPLWVPLPFSMLFHLSAPDIIYICLLYFTFPPPCLMPEQSCVMFTDGPLLLAYCLPYPEHPDIGEISWLRDGRITLQCRKIHVSPSSYSSQHNYYSILGWPHLNDIQPCWDRL